VGTFICVHFDEEFGQASNAIDAFREDLLFDAGDEVVGAFGVVNDGFIEVLCWFASEHELPEVLFPAMLFDG
jgi:hypothetical protein